MFSHWLEVIIFSANGNATSPGTVPIYSDRQLVPAILPTTAGEHGFHTKIFLIDQVRESDNIGQAR
jgi:hypothetical protein